jgi:nicotinamide-nucleotide amidase
MQAEIIAIGTELLLGATVDTNSAYLAQQLATIGVPLVRVSLVRDVMDEIVHAITTASARSELVICSGGLGPTDDDLTREAIATALDQPLEFHQFLLNDIAARFAQSNRTMSETNRRQAFVPRDAYIIRNPRGTAPAFVASRDVEGTPHLVAALPGVPQELYWLTENALLPYLRDEHGLSNIIVVREVRVTGLPESVAGERIADMMNLVNPVVGITAKRGQHTIRIAATATSREAADALIAPLVHTIAQRFGEHLIGDETLEQATARLLVEHDIALALREAVVEMPVFRMLAASADGRTALGRGTAIMRPWDDAEGALDEATLVHAAHAMLDGISGRAAHPLALVVVPEAEHPDVELRTVHVLLTDGEQHEYAARGFDLRIGVGYDLLASMALELVRRRLSSTP